jgi:hypothetical protein
MRRRVYDGPMPHPLVDAVARALPQRAPPEAARYLELLERRLTVLAASEWPVPATAEERAIARRFLRRFHASWHDGDENVVRGYLDRWQRAEDDPQRAAASGLNEAALALVAQAARPETLWFFLWELESVLESETA